MERKRAIAVAVTVTCVLGSSAVALAATTGVPVLGFGRSQAADAAEVSTVWRASTPKEARRRVVTRTKDVFDKVVVDVPEAGAASATSPAAPGATWPGSVPTTVEAHPHPTTAAPQLEPSTDDDDAPSPTGQPRPPESERHDAPETSRTMPADTTTVRPPGVPADWPADKPIPPMPPDCRQPQLEGNGVWNCQDD